MTVLLEQTLPRSLHTWVQEWIDAPTRPLAVQAWLFESAQARRAAEARLHAAGISAQLRSAYKPLWHHFLEEVDTTDLAHVRIRYPVHPRAAPLRFLLEAYPVHTLLTGVDLQCEALPLADAQPQYEVALAWRDGRTRTDSVLAPSHLQDSPMGEPLLSPSAWVRVQGEGQHSDGARTSDYQAVFALAMATVRAQAWPAAEPYFERLRIEVDLPGPLASASAHADLHEALHEDLYFSLLEFFQRHSGRAQGDRRLQPGQFVPIVRPSDDVVRLRITLQAHGEAAGVAVPAAVAPQPTPLDAVQAPLGAPRVAEALAAIPGTRFCASSRQGRAVPVVYHPGPGPAVFLSAGQHANETSGVVGVLRAAQQLAGRAHFAVLPLENPDGYALHAELCAIAPTQMHHAARYSALGDDIEYRAEAPWLERAARQWALATSGASLHVNLHGYPAHEWTRPFNGYIPQGFELWTLPKGFFLIMRHRAGWRARAEALLRSVCDRLAEDAALMAFNAEQQETYRRYRGGEFAFETIRGTVCTIQEMDSGPPMTLITEFPDQTLQGPAFQFAHQAQTQAALAAVHAWTRLAPH